MSRDLEILLDIQYACREIQGFIAGLDHETFHCRFLAVNEPKRRLHHQRADPQRTTMKPEDLDWLEVIQLAVLGTQEINKGFDLERSPSDPFK